MTCAKCSTFDPHSNGPGSSQNLPSAYFIREQWTLAEPWPPLSLEGCETNNILKVVLVWDASQSKHLQNLRTVRAVEGSQGKQHLCSTRGQAPRIFRVCFFFHRESWTFINPPQEPPILPSLHGFFWERITYQIPQILLSSSLTFFSPPDHRNLAAGISPDVSKAIQRTYSAEVLHSLKTVSCGVCQIIRARRNSNHRLSTLCSPEDNQNIHLRNLTETLQLKRQESTDDLQAIPRRNVSMSELSKVNSNMERNSVCKCFYISQRKNFEIRSNKHLSNLACLISLVDFLQCHHSMTNTNPLEFWELWELQLHYTIKSAVPVEVHKSTT